jgi:putative peptide zinc metalloprotease protein
MFVASVSTLLFNANPLLRYDGYYIFSDLVEIPNLYQRSKQYLYYLVKKYAWGVRQAQNPATSNGEKAYLGIYSVASTIYRVVICVGILLFVSQKLFFLGVLLAVAAVVAWVLVPLGKFVHYLGTNGELARVRGRAILSTIATFAAVIVGIGLIPAPDRARVEGVVEPVTLEIVHTQEDGWIRAYRETGALVAPGDWLVRTENPELAAHAKQLAAEKEEVTAQLAKAAVEDQSAWQALEVKLAELEKEISNVNGQLAALSVGAPQKGTWISPRIDETQGIYAKRGERLGVVADMSELVVVATAGQKVAGLLTELHSAGKDIPLEIRMRGRPDEIFGGTILSILPAGQEQLPSAALGYQAGGSMATKADDRQGMHSTEQFFQIRVVPSAEGQKILRSGQVVMVRFEMEEKPLARQWERSLYQLFQVHKK